MATRAVEQRRNNGANESYERVRALDVFIAFLLINHFTAFVLDHYNQSFYVVYSFFFFSPLTFDRLFI